jgi:ribosomal protein S2
MLKLTDYAKMAADEYVQEVGSTELNARWIAEFFQDCGVQDAYPRQDLVAFAEMVQKELTKKEERAIKNANLQLDKIIRNVKLPRKPRGTSG